MVTQSIHLHTDLHFLSGQRRICSCTLKASMLCLRNISRHHGGSSPKWFTQILCIGTTLKQMKFSVHCIDKVKGVPGRNGKQEEHLYQLSFCSNLSMIIICCWETKYWLIQALNILCVPQSTPTWRNYHDSLKRANPAENESQNNVWISTVAHQCMN